MKCASLAAQCIVMMHAGYETSRTPQPSRRQGADLDFTASSKGRCAGSTSMDSTSIVDVRTGVVSIIRELAEACELFKEWRKGRAGKKAVGQEECETSLHEGKTAIEDTFNRFSRQYGARFDSGDSKDSPTASSGRCADTLTRKIPGQHNHHSKELPRRCRRRIDKFCGREGRKGRHTLSN